MRIAGTLITLALISLCAGCSSERGLEPKPVRSLLYAARLGAVHGSIDVIDCETDSLVRTITDSAFREILTLVPSPDGKYLMINGYSGALIWDVASDQSVATLSPEIHDGVFVPEQELFVGVGPAGTFVHAVPDGRLLAHFDDALLGAIHIPGTNRIIAMDRERVIRHNDLSTLLVFDFRLGETIDSIAVHADESVESVRFYTMTVSPDGLLLYGGGPIPGVGYGIVCYDLIGDSVRFTSETGYLSSCAVSPDAKELWITEPGFAADHGSVRVIDAVTGGPIALIETSQYGSLELDEIEFCVESKRTYVRSQYVKPILVIDRSTHAIEQALKPTATSAYSSIALVRTSY